MYFLMNPLKMLLIAVMNPYMAVIYPTQPIPKAHVTKNDEKITHKHSNRLDLKKKNGNNNTSLVSFRDLTKFKRLVEVFVSSFSTCIVHF